MTCFIRIVCKDHLNPSSLITLLLSPCQVLPSYRDVLLWWPSPDHLKGLVEPAAPRYKLIVPKELEEKQEQGDACSNASRGERAGPWNRGSGLHTGLGIY